jgi:hypothetical protein
MKAVWLKKVGGPEVLVAAEAPDQGRYCAPTCGTHYERIQKDDEDNRC